MGPTYLMIFRWKKVVGRISVRHYCPPLWISNQLLRNLFSPRFPQCKTGESRCTYNPCPSIFVAFPMPRFIHVNDGLLFNSCKYIFMNSFQGFAHCIFCIGYTADTDRHFVYILKPGFDQPLAQSVFTCQQADHRQSPRTKSFGGYASRQLSLISDIAGFTATPVNPIFSDFIPGQWNFKYLMCPYFIVQPNISTAGTLRWWFAIHHGIHLIRRNNIPSECFVTCLCATTAATF